MVITKTSLSQRSPMVLLGILVISVLLTGALGLGVWCGLGNGCARPQYATLTASSLRVSVLEQLQNIEEVLVPLKPRDIREGDRITLNDQGAAELKFPDFLTVKLYRDSAVDIDGEVDPNASPFYKYKLTRGLVLNNTTPTGEANRRVVVTTPDGVEIEDLGTRFLVYHEPQRGWTWVIVMEGEVSVRVAGREVTVKAQQQTWVERGNPPVPPIPAMRAAVQDLSRFPLFDNLTNGALQDGDVLQAHAVTVNPVTVRGGDSSQGTITLSRNEAAGRTTIALSSSRPEVVQVPQSVVVTADSMSATFPISTSAVTQDTPVVITAKRGDVEQTAVLMIQAQQASSTPSVTVTATPTFVLNSSPTATATETTTETATSDATPPATMSTPTRTGTPTMTATITPTSTRTPTITDTPTVTDTPTPTFTPTITTTVTFTPTVSPTLTLTPTVSPTPTLTPTVSPTMTFTPTITSTIGPNNIRDLRGVDVAPNELDVTVNYIYNGDHGADSIYMAAFAIQENGREIPNWSFVPHDVQVGDGRATIRITMRSGDGTFTSTMVKVCMYVEGAQQFYCEQFPYKKEWRVGGTQDGPSQTTPQPSDLPSPPDSSGSPSRPDPSVPAPTSVPDPTASPPDLTDSPIPTAPPDPTAEPYPGPE